MQTGKVMRSTGSWYEVRLPDDQILSCRLPGKFRRESKGLTNPVAVGDVVDVGGEEGEFIIRNIHDRDNYLIRRSSRLDKQFQIVASNLDLAIIMVSMRSPKTSTGFLDRFLLSCESFGIEAVILINKTDLLLPEDEKQLQTLKNVYRDMGYLTISTSLKGAKIPKNVLSVMRGKHVLVFGQSGVGKSTMINSLLGTDRQRTSDVSSFHSKGVHTTTFAECFKWDEDSYVIDTPGVREFGIIDIEAWEVGHYSRDIAWFSDACSFNNCLHIHEPGCAVIEAVEKGEIAAFRYRNYVSVLESEFDVKK